MRLIPHAIVDAIISRDMIHTAQDHYTLYILNPLMTAAYPYAYDYGTR
jgi:hypothetical protein